LASVQPAEPAPVSTDPDFVPAPDAFETACAAVVDAAAAQVATVDIGVAAAEIEENIDNGVAPVEQPAEVAPAVQEPEVAPVAQIPSPIAAPRATSKGLKIEKDRPTQNGVRQPSAGGLCRAVWDWCSDFYTDHAEPPTAKEVRAHAEAIGWNTNNASIEFYNWRKFNGIRGRKVA